MKSPFGLVISVVFLAYIAHTMYTFYGLFFPKPCVSKQPLKCIKPYLSRSNKLELAVYTSLKKVHLDERDLTLVWIYDNFTVSNTAERTFKVSIPRQTRKNGTLYVHAFVYPRNEDVFVTKYSSHVSGLLTEYAIPQSETFSLLGSNKKNDSTKDYTRRMTHWRPKLTVNVLQDEISFDRYALPGEIYRLIKPSPEGDYLPVVFIDELGFRTKDLVPINASSRHLPLSITYSPISIGKLRMWAMMIESMTTLHNLGFTEKDTDEIKGIFVDTNFYFLMLTFLVAAFHLLFDFLAFKNDISFWKNRNSMEGLSIRVVSWRCISTIIIFLYLMDESTSLLVLIPAGIGTIIEMWKVTKAFKMKLVWHGVKPSIEWGETTEKEKQTAEFDSQAMKYLSYVLYPLCIGGAVYSLMYTQHKSWYSWMIQSLVNGVYAFGFLFMLPQLFLNYKLKSVAHLPWRAFMYKAFNTFIDDVFAFIITMPTAHRLACFRDDVVFVIYLYQKWLYPVDRSRVNEYGVSYEDDKSPTSPDNKDIASHKDKKSDKAKKID